MLFPDWIKKGIISFPFYPLDVYPFTPLLRGESYLVSTSSPPDIIIKYISLSLLRSCFVLRYTLDFSIGARALSTEAQIEE